MSYSPQYGQQPGYGQQQPGYGAPSPQHSGGGVFTDFKFSPLEWGAVAAWAVGFILLLISYFADWLTIGKEGANLGKFMDVPDNVDTSVDTLSPIFIVVSILALLASAAAIVLSGKARLIGRIVAGLLALVTLLFVILLMAEISSTFFDGLKNLPDGAGFDYGYAAGAYLGLLGSVLLVASAALAHRSTSGVSHQPGYGQQ